ncbi:MAG: helix-turn-helix transcriptional regulator [Archangium sp.]|nr:helix-turn-helix transcriptional regulator [Archangium sp.]
MSATPGLVVETLKQLLKAQGVTYPELAKALGVSLSSVKRLFSATARDFSAERVEKVCRHLNMTFFELMRLVEQKSSREQSVLSPKQESAFVQDPRLFFFFLSIAKKTPLSRLESRFKLSRAQVLQYLGRLARLGLVELRDGTQFRLKVAEHLTWSRGGPIDKWLYEMGRKVFLSSRFDQKNEFFRFYIVKFTDESYFQFRARLESLAQEILEKSLDLDLMSTEARRTAVLVAFKPVDFPTMELHARR